MTIQLSVTVWTVICFLLLMLILNNLLFKPILKLMDKRKERIDNAAKKLAEIEKIEAEHSALVEQKNIEFEKEQRLILKAELNRAREDSVEHFERAKQERLDAIEACQELTERQHNEILEILSVHTMDLARSFADSIVKE